MGRGTDDSEALFEDLDGPHLVGLGNWLVDQLELSELEKEQVLLLYMLLERATNALMQAFPEVLGPLFMRMLQALDDDE
jgi:hypothetical protein